MVDKLKLSVDARDNDGTYSLPVFIDVRVIGEKYLTTTVRSMYSNVSFEMVHLCSEESVIMLAFVLVPNSQYIHSNAQLKK